MRKLKILKTRDENKFMTTTKTYVYLHKQISLNIRKEKYNFSINNSLKKY